ncbi:hypothetical protein LPU83_pLPU83c_0059 (plasmid) [Rhizobium favelukesii]|uniref:Uncharacterized protein n=1 Tax=Rhizobium favelukesii TaxID=348824 RepID=W6S2I7_9HYPH|nr:hypothetical protein LPU83_pLPU83c_0059 [Rhizobium favelukesii]
MGITLPIPALRTASPTNAPMFFDEASGRDLKRQCSTSHADLGPDPRVPMTLNTLAG